MSRGRGKCRVEGCKARAAVLAMVKTERGSDGNFRYARLAMCRHHAMNWLTQLDETGTFELNFKPHSVQSYLVRNNGERLGLTNEGPVT